MPSLLTLKVGPRLGYVMSGVLRASTRIAVLTIIFALATYTALNIQTNIGDSPTFNKTLGLGSPLIVDSDSLYVNPTAIITNAALTTIACSVLAKGKPGVGLTKYPLGIITVYAILSAALYLVITTEPAYTCTPLPTNLDSMTVFMASMVIGPATPLVYALKKRWRVNGDWKPLLFTLYVSIVVGSLIIDVATAPALCSISQLAPACIGSVIIGAYGPVDGLVTALPLGLLAGYTVISTIKT